MNKFVFTCGDTNGIGPEIAVKALNQITERNKKDQFILIIPQNIFDSTIELIEPRFHYKSTNKLESNILSSSGIIVLKLKSAKQNPGNPTVHSGRAAYQALQSSFEILKGGYTDAVITAPVSKSALNLAGVKYPGQTEMFADWCSVKNFVMTFLSKNLRVGLYSIHIPLKEVSKSLNIKQLQIKLQIVNSMLTSDLGISNPKIALLGLNPHAGENGIIGDEEQKIMKPSIHYRNKFSNIQGPFSSDAFFAQKKFKEFDFVFGLYHDQVLIPFKYINAGRGVNFSAGLPIVRTSPDHGVAYDIAGKGIADESSMIEAYKYARIILKNRKANRST